MRALPILLRLLLLALLLPPLQVAAGEVCVPGQCIRIGTWNVEWLGGNKRDNHSFHRPEDIRWMANLITNDLQLDIVALQEVNAYKDGPYKQEWFSTSQYRQLATLLKNAGYSLQTGKSGMYQQIVLAWRKDRVSLITPVAELPVRDVFYISRECKSKNLRKPIGGYFRAGQFDFHLIAVHLKSGYGDSKCASRVRSQQVQDLITHIDTLRNGKEKDVIVIGDFNGTPKDKSLDAFYSQRQLHTVSAFGRTATASGKYTYLSKSGGSQLDHIMLEPAHTQEWIDNSTMIYQPQDKHTFMSRYSDHVPVWAGFSTLRDDD